MTFAAHVKGGTGAGRKVQKQAEPWLHHCRREIRPDEFVGQVEQFEYAGRWIRYPRKLSGNRYSCPDCGTRRP